MEFFIIVIKKNYNNTFSSKSFFHKNKEIDPIVDKINTFTQSGKKIKKQIEQKIDNTGFGNKVIK